jgi:hypothetical protein
MSLSPHIHGTSSRAANYMTSNDGEPGSKRRNGLEVDSAQHAISKGIRSMLTKVVMECENDLPQIDCRVLFCYNGHDAFATVCSSRGGRFRPDLSPPFLPAV